VSGGKSASIAQAAGDGELVKAKGVGELGLSGAAAAISNAVYNATGVRARDYPVTLDKLLDRMPTAT
jgi:xanthine dehydrogenase YagR molybdenum-binding subunit